METIGQLSFLPTSVKEIEALGWDTLDVILFTGDAYIDHPSFGAAVIGRTLQSMGLKVAIVPQPNWRDDLRDFKKLGKPNLFFAVTAGNMDSMVNHYTANKRLRSDDAYTAGGASGARPDYAVTVYSHIIKKLYPEVPLIIGGIEASLRRLTHYDYWADCLKPSVLVESGADLLIYGMGEKPIKELVVEMKKGRAVSEIKDLPQSVYAINKKENLPEWESDKTLIFSSFDECKKDKMVYGRNFKRFEEESNKMVASRIVEPYGNKLVVVNPPYPSLSQDDIDEPFNFPYTRLPHFRYKDKPVPAYEMIKNSINMHRGCFGGCSFCTISAHQGKFVQSRSPKSVINEVEQLVKTPGFNGTITDLGGPSANMYQMKGIDEKLCEKCTRPSCIYPTVCRNLNANHDPMTEIYKKVSDMQGVKHVHVGSGLRYDIIYGARTDKDQKSGKEYLKQLVGKHVSGRLKVAPEHTSDNVLQLMRKPSFSLFHKLKHDFDKISAEAGKNQQLIPYFISSHPAATTTDMAELAVETKKLGMKLEQVQDFTPTPMTLASCIFYTGVNPYNAQHVYVPRSAGQKREQQSFFFWYKPEWRDEIKRSLQNMKRLDLLDNLLGTSKPLKPLNEKKVMGYKKK